MNLSSNQFGRVVRDLLLLLRYRVEVYEDTVCTLDFDIYVSKRSDNKSIIALSIKSQGYNFGIILNSPENFLKRFFFLKGVLGNLTDFEDIVSEYVELSELSTVMCVRIIGDDISEEVTLF